jgi:hypothetical protein
MATTQGCNKTYFPLFEKHNWFCFKMNSHNGNMRDVCFCYKLMKINKCMEIWLKNVDMDQVYFTKSIKKIIAPIDALFTWVNFVSSYKYVLNLLLEKTY